MLPIEGTSSKECKLHATSLSQVIIYQMKSFECLRETNGGKQDEDFPVVDCEVIWNNKVGVVSLSILKIGDFVNIPYCFV